MIRELSIYKTSKNKTEIAVARIYLDYSREPYYYVLDIDDQDKHIFYDRTSLGNALYMYNEFRKGNPINIVSAADKKLYQIWIEHGLENGTTKFKKRIYGER